MGTGRGLLLALAVFAGSLTAVAQAEEMSPPSGEVVIGASAQITPTMLPRSRPVPATLTVGFTSSSSSGGPVPALSEISLTLARGVQLEADGVPSCRLHELFEVYEGIGSPCLQSLVGRGRVVSEIAAPGEPTVTVEGQLNAYYDGLSSKPLVFAQITTGEPLPLVYVIPFEIDSGPGSATTLRVSRPVMDRLPGEYVSEGELPSYDLEGVYSQISEFQMSLHRVSAGVRKRRSFVEADCPARNPRRRAVLPLLHLSLGYERGLPTQSRTVSRSCRVAP